MTAILTLEDFLAQHDAGATGYGDAGLHRSHMRVGKSTRRRQLARQAAKDQALAARRHELAAEYHRLVAAGEIREPTRLERLRATAAGHSDNAAVQAARRMLAKLETVDG